MKLCKEIEKKEGEAYYVTNGIKQTHDKPFKTSTAAISHANKEEDRTGRTHIVTHVKDGKIKRQWQYSPDHRGYASYTDYAGEDARSHGIKESVEQIDELKKSTLGSYIKKSTANIAGRSAAAAVAVTKGDKEFTKDNTRRLTNRFTGIKRATDKLTKEEVELDEASDVTMKQLEKEVS